MKLNLKKIEIYSVFMFLVIIVLSLHEYGHIFAYKTLKKLSFFYFPSFSKKSKDTRNNSGIVLSLEFTL